MNKSPNKALIAECDRMIQEIACLGESEIGTGQAQVGHHMIGRANMFYRHDLRNIVPLRDYYHGGSPGGVSQDSPHVSPKDFEARFCREPRHLKQWKWCKNHRNEYHKNPDRTALLATLAKLRAFLAKGEPYRWKEQNDDTEM